MVACLLFFGGAILAERDTIEGDLLLREVQDELRQERMMAVFKKYGVFFAIGALVLIVAVAGYQIWQGVKDRRAEAESRRFAEAVLLIGQNQPDKAIDALKELAGASQDGYALLASLRQAALLAETGKSTEAIAVYDQIAKNYSSQPLWADLAIIRQAMLNIDASSDIAALEMMIAPLMAPTRPWRHSATEIMAVLALKKGDEAKARELLQSLTQDEATPGAMKARAADMLASLGRNDQNG